MKFGVRLTETTGTVRYKASLLTQRGNLVFEKHIL